MNTERLLKLAALLDNVPKEKFDMGTWGYSRRVMRLRPQCATTACAFGWATAIPEFREAGLGLEARPGTRYADVSFRSPDNCERSYNLVAAKEFFEIDALLAHTLFYGSSRSPQAKAREIRAVVREYLADIVGRA